MLAAEHLHHHGGMSLDFTLSPEHQAIRQTARDLFKRFEPRRDEIRREMVKQRRFPAEVWQAISDAGFMGCMVPEEYGGTAMGLLPMAFLIEDMAAMGWNSPVMVLTTMDALCIAKSGSTAVKQAFLPRIADGSAKFCFALTEADAGSNTFRIKTFAKRQGDTYVINGSKQWITGADVTDYMLLAVRTTTREACIEKGLPKAFGLSLLIVPTNAKGLSKTLLPTGAIEGMNQWTLHFDNVEVPALNLVGEENAGAAALFRALNPERILVAASAVGSAQYCLDIACAYAKERKVFRDTPIGQYQAIQHPLADVKLRQEAVRWMVYKAAWHVDNATPPMETALAANAAKYLAAELGLQAVDAALETLGGNGFSEEVGLTDMWQGMRLFKTVPVSKEMVLNYVAEHVLHLPRSY